MLKNNIVILATYAASEIGGTSPCVTFRESRTANKKSREIANRIGNVTRTPFPRTARYAARRYARIIRHQYCVEHRSPVSSEWSLYRDFQVNRMPGFY